MTNDVKTLESIEDLTTDPGNLNRGTDRGREMLGQSFDEVGAGRSIVVDRRGVVLGGNKTRDSAAERALPIRVVETSGDELVVVQRTDLDLAGEGDERRKARRLAAWDNRANETGLAWDGGLIGAQLEDDPDIFAGIFEDDELSAILAQMDEGYPDPDGPGTEVDDDRLTREDVPDAIYPTDNDWGIPVLLPDLQADAVDLPVSLWGAVGRKRKMPGTWMFYVDDYRFEALWSDPSDVVNSECMNVAEPNFTIGPQTPRAVALWQIYRKRWLARFWQSCGIGVFVDLNIDVTTFGDLALLGVPEGWRAYVTRGYTERIDYTLAEFEFAKGHAGTDGIIFLVYGGGQEVKEVAKRHRWAWIPEHMDTKREGVVHG